jgi:outer membrane murein-binding lipoprotein Lpp
VNVIEIIKLVSEAGSIGVTTLVICLQYRREGRLARELGRVGARQVELSNDVRDVATKIHATHIESTSARRSVDTLTRHVERLIASTPPGGIAVTPRRSLASEPHGGE